MNNELDFDLDELQTDHTTAQQTQTAYKQAIDDLDTEMNGLSSAWETGATGISATFLDLYNEKKEVLNDANDLMVELINAMQTKINDFQAAADATKAAFK